MPRGSRGRRSPSPAARCNQSFGRTDHERHVETRSNPGNGRKSTGAGWSTRSAPARPIGPRPGRAARAARSRCRSIPIMRPTSCATAASRSGAWRGDSTAIASASRTSSSCLRSTRCRRPSMCRPCVRCSIPTSSAASSPKGTRSASIPGSTLNSVRAQASPCGRLGGRARDRVRAHAAIEPAHPAWPIYAPTRRADQRGHFECRSATTRLFHDSLAALDHRERYPAAKASCTHADVRPLRPRACRLRPAHGKDGPRHRRRARHRPRLRAGARRFRLRHRAGRSPGAGDGSDRARYRGARQAHADLPGRCQRFCPRACDRRTGQREVHS